MTWLLDHPPVRDQFRRTRRALVSGTVVVHTGESATSPDGLGLARFIQSRSTPGSYHTVTGWKSWLRLIPYEFEAYGDGTGSNSHAVHLSFATMAAAWPSMTAAQRDGFIEQGAQAAADFARWLHAERGIRIPARRITRAESEDRVPGFISHGERDPERRTDPGAAFPWGQFLTRFAQLTDDEAPSEEDDDMALIVRGDKTAHWWITDGLHKDHIETKQRAAELVFTGLAKWNNDGPFVVPQDMVDAIPTVNKPGNEPEIARQVLAGLGDTALSDEQVRSIIDAIPGQVKVALREGSG